MPNDTTDPTTLPDALPLAERAPLALEEGERIELWLAESVAEPTASPREAADGDVGEFDIDGWDVRPAQVSAVAGPFVAVAAGGWGLSGDPGTPSAPGARAILRRLGVEGIVEWEGTIATGAEIVSHSQETDRNARHAGGLHAGGAEAILIVHLDPDAGALHQRRRSPRLAVRLSPVRLVPLPESTPPGTVSPALTEDPDLAPVARLSDVSLSGAAIVVDTPLETGTTVSVEFELPGEMAPFRLRGRVVEPASALHGEVQPQPDGLPGFRRGIEFLGHTASRESRRLAAVLTRLLQSESSRHDRR